jgi:hypothetical protein
MHSNLSRLGEGLWYKFTPTGQRKHILYRGGLVMIEGWPEKTQAQHVPGNETAFISLHGGPIPLILDYLGSASG